MMATKVTASSVFRTTFARRDFRNSFLPLTGPDESAQLLLLTT